MTDPDVWILECKLAGDGPPMAATMNTDAAKLLAALCDPLVSTSEAVGALGADAGLLAVPKPSRERPQLQAVPLPEVWPPQRGRGYMTMNRGQWDALLSVAYAGGWVLIEMDDDDKPARAYLRLNPEVN